MLELHAGQHGMPRGSSSPTWGSRAVVSREDFVCSLYSTLKVSQSRPVGGTMGRRDNMSTITEVGKQQDSKYRQPGQRGLNSVCAGGVAGTRWVRQAVLCQRYLSVTLLENGLQVCGDLTLSPTGLDGSGMASPVTSGSEQPLPCT